MNLQEKISYLVSIGKSEDSICDSLETCEKFGSSDCCMVKDCLPGTKAVLDGTAKPFATTDVISGSFDKTDEGYLVFANAKLARTGIQEYFAFELGTPDGMKPMDKIRVYRPDEEVFKPSSMDSFSLKPVTNGHPPVMVDQGNLKKFQVGVVGENIRREDSHMVARVVVTDPKAIQDIEDGKVELSNGYLSDYVWESGTTPDGEQYDAKQVNIRGNHVALVDKGRCGGSCRVLDSIGLKDCGCESQLCNCKENKVMADAVTFNVFGIDLEIPKAAAQGLKKALDQEAEEKSKLEKKLDALNEEKKKLEDQIAEEKKKTDQEKEKLEGERDELKVQLESTDVDKLVSERMEFLSKVKKINKDFEVEGKDEKEIIRTIVSDAYPNEDFKEKSEDYLQSRFDVLVSSGGTSSMKDALGKAASEKGSDTPNSDEARNKFIEDNKDSYKLPSERAN